LCEKIIGHFKLQILTRKNKERRKGKMHVRVERGSCRGGTGGKGKVVKGLKRGVMCGTLHGEGVGERLHGDLFAGSLKKGRGGRKGGVDMWWEKGLGR